MALKFNPVTGALDVVLDKASEIINTPAGSISALTVQTALNELDTEKQPTGNYLTALTGEVTASGPGSAAATITNNAVTAAKLSAILQAGLSSGIVSGGAVTINADPTKIDIAAGTGFIVDYWTTPATPVIYNVTWSAQIGVTVTYLATSTLSFVAINTSSAPTQFPAFPDHDIRREIILLAQLGHTAGTSVQNVSPQYAVYQSPIDQFRDLIQDFGFVNSENIISANGANLNINKSSGTLLGFGLNYTNDIQNPNIVTINASTGTTFQYRTQTGVTAANTTSIVPTNYDNAGTVTAIGGSNNQATNQRVFLFPNGNVRIQYGQTIYSTLGVAIQAVSTEAFVVYENISQGAALIGILSVTKGATDLSDTAQARFLRVSKLGEFAVGGAGVSTSNLQQVYNNSSDPEILTDASRGALSIKRGSAADTDAIIEGLNAAGTITFSVTGNGQVQSTTLTASQIVLTDASKNLVSSGTLSVALGGTNSSVALNNNRVIQSSAGAIVEAAAITASRALVSDANGIPTHATTTSTEIGYVNGVTSAIQTQLDAKQAKLRTIVSVSSNVTLTTNAIHLTSTAAARSLTLPSPVSGTEIIVKDVTGTANVNNITIVRFGSETIEGVAASYAMDQTYQSITLIADGTNWWIC